jgi:hypothetical protein
MHTQTTDSQVFTPTVSTTPKPGRPTRNYSRQDTHRYRVPVGKHAGRVATARDQHDAVGAVAPREGSQPIRPRDTEAIGHIAYRHAPHARTLDHQPIPTA